MYLSNIWVVIIYSQQAFYPALVSRFRHPTAKFGSILETLFHYIMHCKLVRHGLIYQPQRIISYIKYVTKGPRLQWCCHGHEKYLIMGLSSHKSKLALKIFHQYFYQKIDFKSKHLSSSNAYDIEIPQEVTNEDAITPVCYLACSTKTEVILWMV